MHHCTDLAGTIFLRSSTVADFSYVPQSPRRRTDLFKPGPHDPVCASSHPLIFVPLCSNESCVSLRASSLLALSLPVSELALAVIVNLIA